MQLTGKDRRFLRALGNPLKPTVMIGRDGPNEAVLAAIDDAHRTAELVKVRVLDTCDLHRREVAEQLDRDSRSVVVQPVGRTILLYRRHPEKPRISRPSAPVAGTS